MRQGQHSALFSRELCVRDEKLHSTLFNEIFALVVKCLPGVMERVTRKLTDDYWRRWVKTFVDLTL